MPDDVLTRPELIRLDEAARQRVSDQIKAKGGFCECCGSADFRVGHALHLGYLFLNEDNDAYMVGLVCRNPDCAKPRTGIVLHEDEFVSRDEGSGATD